MTKVDIGYFSTSARRVGTFTVIWVRSVIPLWLIGASNLGGVIEI